LLKGRISLLLHKHAASVGVASCNLPTQGHAQRVLWLLVLVNASAAHQQQGATRAMDSPAQHNSSPLASIAIVSNKTVVPLGHILRSRSMAIVIAEKILFATMKDLWAALSMTDRGQQAECSVLAARLVPARLFHLNGISFPAVAAFDVNAWKVPVATRETTRVSALILVCGARVKSHKHLQNSLMRGATAANAGRPAQAMQNRWLPEMACVNVAAQSW